MLAIEAVELVACFHVPGDYLSNAHAARLQYFLELRAQKRVRLIQNFPKGPVGRSNMWVIIFQAGVDKKPLTAGGTAHLYADHTEADGSLQYRGMVWDDTD